VRQTKLASGSFSAHVLSVYAVVQCIRERRRVRWTTSNTAQLQADRPLWRDPESGRGESNLSHRRSTSVCTHSLHVMHLLRLS